MTIDHTLVDDRLKARRVAAISLAAAVFLIAIKLAAALASGSLALLSEAAHSALDAGATALTYFAIRIASRPPDEEHPYGHGKAENISALLETFVLFGLAIFIATRAVERLQGGGRAVTAEWYVFAVMGVSIFVDGNRARILSRMGKALRSPALQADALHFAADLMTSIVVLAGLFLVRAGFPEADAIGSLVIAAYVAFSSIRLGKKSVDVLMDRAPTGAMARIEEVALAVPGVEEVRRVRLRYAGGQPQTDVVIAISRRVPLETAHHVTEEVERAVKALEPGADVVVHVEPLADETMLTQQVEAIAARQSQVAEVHNIFVATHPEGLHVSLHVKFPGDMSLAEAHAIAESLEAEITREVEGVKRVDTHLEPLAPRQKDASDVTARESTLVAWTRALAEQLPEVYNCHEILVSSEGRGLALVIHCEAESGLSVDAVHDASTKIEDSVHRRWPEVIRVTVHFEPEGS